MRVPSFEYCTIRYLRQAGVQPGDRVQLSMPDLTRLVRYTRKYFENVPPEAGQFARMSRSDQAVYNGFEVVLAAMLDKRAINIPFTGEDNVSAVRDMIREVHSVLSPITAWSRRYINEMPQDLKVKIFSQKLSTQEGYLKFAAKNPGWQMEDMIDFSSGRYFTHRSVYKLLLIDVQSGIKAAYILKPAIEKTDIICCKPLNEEFYSRYLALFDRDPVRIDHYAGLNFIEYVEGVPSRELLDGYRLEPKYAHLGEELIKWLAEEAALADAVLKGDRDIGFQSGGVWGQYIIVPGEGGKSVRRIVSIDHEFVFNRTDLYTIESAENGMLEMSYLTAFREFGDSEQRRVLFQKFKAAYKDMREKIISKKEEVGTLIGTYFMDIELQIFEKNLRQDPDQWLEMLFKKVELFWRKQNEAR